ncbi:MAG TPA: mannose-1-phosphate guanylyltransferase/mannose-6-phosphate isomerase [Beijerinckiaceae bacterium]|nr:mannose-1-phosphate guanylyltransferase/mannose-6-phosphate isomerase [Beijerinckiaceae bacterium]
MLKILPVIMCGGAGTRLWPESRETLPKQFIPLLGARSTFQETALLLARADLFEKPIVVSNHDYRFLIAEQLAQIGLEADIVLEPLRRDSGPAVAVAAELAVARSPSTVVVVMAADHNVDNPGALIALCADAAVAATKGHIVTLGIAPTHAATGYGYIRPGASLSGAPGVRVVEAFVEKPDEPTAETYVKSGYLWNSGNFIFRADVMKGEIERFEPEMAAAAAGAVGRAKQDLQFLLLDAEAFGQAPKKSIDYAVMERTGRAAVIPADIGWSDVGTWSAVHTLAETDAAGNSVRGHGVVIESSNVHVRSDGHLTAVVGVDGVIVVTTQDAVLVLGAKHADKVKDLVEKLKSENRREALEHKRIYRPWGYYQSIDQGQRYQVKRLFVKPGGQLSLQRHHHRAEHWVVVKGTAEVTLDGKVSQVFENQSIYLPMGAMHRLANPGKIDLELIEVQTGSYLGEDDIVRVEDVYHRC